MKGAWPNNFGKGMLLGGLTAMLICLLMGAVHYDGPSLPVAGARSARGQGGPALQHGPLPDRHLGGGRRLRGLCPRYLNRRTKVVYSSIKGPGGKTVNNLGKPFHQM